MYLFLQALVYFPHIVVLSRRKFQQPFKHSNDHKRQTPLGNYKSQKVKVVEIQMGKIPQKSNLITKMKFKKLPGLGQVQVNTDTWCCLLVLEHLQLLETKYSLRILERKIPKFSLEPVEPHSDTSTRLPSTATRFTGFPKGRGYLNHCHEDQLCTCIFFYMFVDVLTSFRIGYPLGSTGGIAVKKT